MSENCVISWTSNSLLRWSDFKAELNPAVFEDSRSVIKYGFTWTVNSDKVNDKIVFLIDSITTVTEFHPLLSWFRESESNDDLLKHEQGHFDLAEMLRRDHDVVFEKIFYDKVFETRGQNEAQRKQFAKIDSGKMISNEVDKLSQILAKKREEYDVETEYGTKYSKPNKIFKYF